MSTKMHNECIFITWICIFYRKGTDAYSNSQTLPTFFLYIWSKEHYARKPQLKLSFLYPTNKTNINREKNLLYSARWWNEPLVSVFVLCWRLSTTFHTFYLSTTSLPPKLSFLQHKHIMHFTMISCFLNI